MITTLVVASVLYTLSLNPAYVEITPAMAEFQQTVEQMSFKWELISSKKISLLNRVEGGGYMSDVMADNILLTIFRTSGRAPDSNNVDWNMIAQSSKTQFVLKSGEVFAFHEDVLPEFEGKVVKTTNSHFDGSQGFKHDGWLMGDGVCHLASLMAWSAKDANLNVVIPKNHDFRKIPGIEKQYGTAIYFNPGAKSANANQNLYIENNSGKDIIFEFNIVGTDVEVNIYQKEPVLSGFSN
jgi:hypothetical protein